jgi:hypothetical protein
VDAEYHLRRSAVAKQAGSGGWPATGYFVAGNNNREPSEIKEGFE